MHIIGLPDTNERDAIRLNIVTVGGVTLGNARFWFYCSFEGMVQV